MHEREVTHVRHHQRSHGNKRVQNDDLHDFQRGDVQRGTSHAGGTSSLIRLAAMLEDGTVLNNDPPFRDGGMVGGYVVFFPS